MKPFSLGLVAVLWVFAASGAQAQAVQDMVFSEVEKRIVRDYYGVPATQQTREDDTPPEWAVRDGDAESDDDQGQRDKPQKDKGQKDKAKGNAKDKGKSKDLPPGLAKRDDLPPGLAKQLKDKGRLPPGLAKRDLPTDLAAQLPARPDSQEVTVVEGDVVLADKATGIILDVIKDVVANGGGVNSDGARAAPSPQDQDAPAAEENLLDAVLKSVFGGGN